MSSDYNGCTLRQRCNLASCRLSNNLFPYLYIGSESYFSGNLWDLIVAVSAREYTAHLVSNIIRLNKHRVIFIKFDFKSEEFLYRSVRWSPSLGHQVMSLVIWATASLLSATDQKRFMSEGANRKSGRSPRNWH